MADSEVEQVLGDVPFRKWECYALQWDVAVEDHIIVGAPNGGPLAVLRDDKKMMVASDRLGGYLGIYSASGNLISQIPWELGRRVAGMGWTEDDELIIVLQDGVVNWYSIHGQRHEEKTQRLFPEGSPRRIADVQVWSYGYVAMADDYTLHIHDGTRTNPQSRLYRVAPGLSGQRSPTSMAVLQPYYDTGGIGATSGGGTGQLQVIIGTSDNCVLMADETGPELFNLQATLTAPITKMAVAPDGRFVGCFAEGLLTVYSTKDFQKVLEPFDTATTNRPLSMGWCGKDSIVLYWRGMGVLMVGPYGDYIHFAYKEPLVLVPEVDCCRIVTTRSLEMLQRVPEATESIHRIGSTQPSAMLYDAMEAFERGDPKADDNLRSIELTSQLIAAVHACLTAAVSEWSLQKQQSYLAAASYGKTFLEAEGDGGDGDDGDDEEVTSSRFDANQFVATCRKLRVLNHLRRPEVGLPLTVTQLDRVGYPALIERLTLRRQHYLALKICDYLRLKKDKVLIQWACDFLQSKRALVKGDDELKEEIRARLESFGDRNVSYAPIARAADKAGRRTLATLLLEYEPQAASQVDLLLEMREFELALSRAIGSSDEDLVYRALLHIDAHKASLDAYLKLLSAYPEATKLLRLYYRHQITPESRSPWFNIALARNDFQEAGTIVALQADMAETRERRSDMMREASRIFGTVKTSQFMQKVTEEQLDLMEIQENLEQRTGKLPERIFSGLSVSETIYNLIVLAAEMPGRAGEFFDEASKIQKKFKVPEKRYWYLKIKALAASGQWDVLKAFASEKKSPVGYKPFAEACILHKQPSSLTESFIDRITQQEDKYDLCVEVKLWQKALEVAVKLKDRARLQEVRTLCNMPGLQYAIDEMLAKM